MKESTSRKETSTPMGNQESSENLSIYQRGNITAHTRRRRYAQQQRRWPLLRGWRVSTEVVPGSCPYLLQREIPRIAGFTPSLSNESGNSGVTGHPLHSFQPRRLSWVQQPSICPHVDVLQSPGPQGPKVRVASRGHSKDIFFTPRGWWCCTADP
ncbi:6-pyruvoyl tetrahydrobiopterin synthase isoform X2 [Crocuta crocuta]